MALLICSYVDAPFLRYFVILLWSSRYVVMLSCYVVMLSCCYVAMLLCCYVDILCCCSVGVLLCRDVADVTTLWWCSVGMLLCLYISCYVVMLLLWCCYVATSLFSRYVVLPCHVAVTTPEQHNTKTST